MFMSATTRFPDILGNDWECKREPPLGKTECPNYNGIGPELLHATGEWMCRKCFKVIGQENSTDDEIQDDDAIDDENKEEVEIAYTAEGERNTDFTPEQALRVRILKTIDKIVANMNQLDQPFAMYMKKNEYEIASMVMNLSKDNVPGFEGERNIKPKVVSVTSHYMKRLPTSNAMRASKVKSNDIRKRKTVIDNMYRTDIGNPMAMNINNIGNQLGVPETITSLAIEEFEKTTPSNSEPKPLARAAAWLYLFAKKKNYKITKQEFDKISNLSRSALNRAIESYRNLPQS